MNTAAAVAAPARPVQDAWDRYAWLWDVYFALALTGTAALVLAADGSSARRWATVGLLVGLGVLYALIGRGLTAMRAGTAPVLYLASVLAVFIAAVVAAPQASWALFVVIPQCFMLLTLRRAIVAAVLLNLVPVGRGFFEDPVVDGRDLGLLVPMALLLAMLSVIVGLWIHVIIRQSAERGELIDRLQDSRREIAELSRRAGVADERERLARDIHDTLAQGFTSITALLEAVRGELDTEPDLARRHIDLALRTSRENLAEARSLVSALTPAPLVSASLSDALARHTDRVAAELGITAETDTEGESRAVPANVAVVLLRAAQESLANVAKHAGAESVGVTLVFLADTVGVRIVDDGRGFDPGAVGTHGYGLSGMSSRLGEVGGRLDVRSATDTGTTIEAWVPA